MKLNDKEKLEVTNLLKLIRRSEFKEFQGLEALALARAYHWLESLLVVPPTPSPESLKSITNQVPLQPIEEKNTFINDLVENKSIKKPKKSRKKDNG